MDARNGRKHRTVVVGNARWMAENLNYQVDSNFCPSNMADISNTEKADALSVRCVEDAAP